MKDFEKWLKLPLPKSPHLCLYGDKCLRSSSITKEELGLIFTGCMALTRVILRNCKTSCKPEYVEWLMLMIKTVAFERKITIGSHNVPSKISQMWQIFLACISDGVESKGGGNVYQITIMYIMYIYIYVCVCVKYCNCHV